MTKQPKPREVTDRYLDTQVKCILCEREYVPANEVPAFGAPVPPLVANNFCSPKCFTEAESRRTNTQKFNLGEQFAKYKEKMQLNGMKPLQERETFNAFCGSLSHLVSMMQAGPVDLQELELQLIAYWESVLRNEANRKNGHQARIILPPKP